MTVICRLLWVVRGHAWARDQSGQVLVEFAMMALVLAIMLTGLLDLWRAYSAYIAVTDAAAEGAAYGATFPDEVIAVIKNRAARSSGGLVTIPVDQVSVITDTETITVTVTYPHTVRFPFMQVIAGGQTVSITQRAVKPILD